MICIVVVIILIVFAYFGSFNDQTYTAKQSKKLSTPIKVLLEKIKKMQYSTKVEDVFSLYYDIEEGLNYIKHHYELSQVRGSQLCREAEIRYKQIHGEDLDDYQIKALCGDLDISEFYSLCIVYVLRNYSTKIKEQIDSLKTKPAKERRKSKIADAIYKSISEINDKGKREYLAPIYLLGKEFNIETEIKLSSIVSIDFNVSN